MVNAITDHIKQIEHGFKHIIEAGNQILEDENENPFELAVLFLNDNSYQVRMLATYILGQLSTSNLEALNLLENKVSQDSNWRVQEMLAKAFDYYCSALGYEQSLPKIKFWLSHSQTNVKRAVIEGLRIWTGKPYFKDHPKIAVELISKYKSEESEYLRKSVGNALRDIGKKHSEIVLEELSTWDLTNRKVLLVYKLAVGK